MEYIEIGGIYLLENNQKCKVLGGYYEHQPLFEYPFIKPIMVYKIELEDGGVGEVLGSAIKQEVESLPQIYTGYRWRAMTKEEHFIMSRENVIKSKPSIPVAGNILMEEFKTMEIFTVVKMRDDIGYDVDRIFYDEAEAVTYCENAHDCRLEIIKTEGREIYYEYSKSY